MMKKKLVLYRETLRHLSPVNMKLVVGGNSLGCAFSTYGTCAGTATRDCPPPNTEFSICECEM